MRAEFIINEGWRQIEDCRICKAPVFTFQTKQAKRPNLSWTHWSDGSLCGSCLSEEMLARHFYQLEQQRSDED